MTVTSFDIRIVYADDSLTDCYFRKLPLTTITQITLQDGWKQEMTRSRMRLILTGIQQEGDFYSE